MSERSRSPSPSRHRTYSGSPVRSRSPHRGYSRSPHRSYGGYGYGGPGYGGWGLGTASGLLLGTALGAAINPYAYQRPYYTPAYGVVEYDIYGRPIIYY